MELPLQSPSSHFTRQLAIQVTIKLWLIALTSILLTFCGFIGAGWLQAQLAQSLPGHALPLMIFKIVKKSVGFQLFPYWPIMWGDYNEFNKNNNNTRYYQLTSLQKWARGYYTFSAFISFCVDHHFADTTLIHRISELRVVPLNYRNRRREISYHRLHATRSIIHRQIADLILTLAFVIHLSDQGGGDKTIVWCLTHNQSTFSNPKRSKYFSTPASHSAEDGTEIALRLWSVYRLQLRWRPQ